MGGNKRGKRQTYKISLVRQLHTPERKFLLLQQERRVARADYARLKALFTRGRCVLINPPLKLVPVMEVAMRHK